MVCRLIVFFFFLASRVVDQRSELTGRAGLLLGLLEHLGRQLGELVRCVLLLPLGLQRRQLGIFRVEILLLLLQGLLKDISL